MRARGAVPWILALAAGVLSGCLHCAGDPYVVEDSGLGYCFQSFDAGPRSGCPCTTQGACVGGLVCACDPWTFFCRAEDVHWQRTPGCEPDASVLDAAGSMDADLPDAESGAPVDGGADDVLASR